eukprot:2359457-Lingulodinium_polyedra.AAC.1
MTTQRIASRWCDYLTTSVQHRLQKPQERPGLYLGDLTNRRYRNLTDNGLLTFEQKRHLCWYC